MASGSPGIGVTFPCRSTQTSRRLNGDPGAYTAVPLADTLTPGRSLPTTWYTLSMTPASGFRNAVTDGVQSIAVRPVALSPPTRNPDSAYAAMTAAPPAGLLAEVGRHVRVLSENT